MLAPNKTIYDKLIGDFSPKTPKYVFRGLHCFFDAFGIAPKLRLPASAPPWDSTEESMATNPRQAERESSDLGHETRKATDQAGQTGRTMVDAAERTTRAGAEAIAQRSMEQFSKMFGLSGEAASETVQQSANNMQAVIESASIVAGGLQDIAGEWMRFAQTRLEQNLDHLDQLRECRSLQDCVALQTQILRDNLEAFLRSAHRTSERTTQFAGTAIRQMSNTSIAPH